MWLFKSCHMLINGPCRGSMASNSIGPFFLLDLQQTGSGSLPVNCEFKFRKRVPVRQRLLQFKQHCCKATVQWQRCSGNDAVTTRSSAAPKKNDTAPTGPIIDAAIHHQVPEIFHWCACSLAAGPAGGYAFVRTIVLCHRSNKSGGLSIRFPVTRRRATYPICCVLFSNFLMH